MSGLVDIEVLEHLHHADGTRELTLLAVDADLEMLADVGGHPTAHERGVAVAWTWGPGMAPADPVAACGRHLEDVLVAWALVWAKENARIDFLDLTA